MIYIANCTKQLLVHCFRVPETGRITVLEIPSGQQKGVGEGLNAQQTEKLVQHMESFGFRRGTASDMKTPDFCGVLYSLDKPFTEGKIIDAHDALVDNLEKRSATEATRSALAFEASTRDKRGGKKGKRLAKITEVSVTQDVPPRERPTGKEVNFSISVAPDGRADARIPV